MKFKPKPGLRLKIPGRGILLVCDLNGATIRCRWVGQTLTFELDEAEWNRLTDRAEESRW
jgi:hypothetical protein